MAFALGAKAVAAGYRLATFDVVGSTSTWAMEQAKAGDPGRLWAVAYQQSHGHGRRGRPWQMPRGNLAASLLVPVGEHKARMATLGFAAGLALENAIGQVAPSLTSEVTLKWPNDVLLNGAKVAGILLEAVSAPDAVARVVIGIGVNVRHAPEGLALPATALAAAADITAEALFEALTDAWIEQQELWEGSGGFTAIRDRWLDRAAGLGAPIAVRMGEQEVRGTFETIDADGRLVVREPGGAARSISAGDVYFGGAATAGR